MKVTTKLFVITLVVVLAVAAFAESRRRVWGYGKGVDTDKNEAIAIAVNQASIEMANQCPEDGQNKAEDFEHRERCYKSLRPDAQSYQYECHVESSVVCITPDH
jgi:hypothetical protein